MQLNSNKAFLGMSSLIWNSILLFFAYLMLLITLQYIPAKKDVAFLQIKEDVEDMLFYRIAFFAHVYTGMFILISGMLQFPVFMRRRFPVLHKWSGSVYALGIIFIAGPAGLLMGFYANGGPVSQVAFCILAILWIFSTWKAVSAARNHDIDSHKIWMYRSYALTLSAVSLRAWKWLLVLLYAPRPMDVYRVVSWLGWTGNLLIAELIIFFVLKKSTKATPVKIPVVQNL